MRAVVLAAGLGARMSPLTAATHKSLLELGGEPILARIINGLEAIGVADLLVVTGHLHEQIEAFCRSRYPGRPIELLHNPRYRDTNNIVSLALALQHLRAHARLDEDVALIECDVLFHPDLLRSLCHPEPGNLALVDLYQPGMDGTVVSIEDGYVAQVFPPHQQTQDFDYRGKYKTVNIYRFDAGFCRNTFLPLLTLYADQIDSNCYYELVLGMVVHARRRTVRAVTVDPASWAEVDDPNDWAAARYRFVPAERRAILDAAQGGHWNFPLLDFNHLRNLHFPTPAMLAALRRALPELVRDYGSSQPVLERKLAVALQCNAEPLIALNGASQAFPYLPDLFEARPALLPCPTFHEYPRWLPQHQTYLDAVGWNLAEWESRLRPGILAVVVNPNNPTGSTVPTAELHALCARHPATAFLVDESFLGFSGQPTLVQALEQAPLDNVLALGSLSKGWGVPGLRLGYVYTHNRAWREHLRARLPIWNMNAMAEFLLELIPKFRGELAESCRRTAADRAELAGWLRDHPGIKVVYAGGANFVLLRLRPPCRAEAVAAELLQRHGIFVKDVTPKFTATPLGGDWLRVAVRLPEENQRLAAALAQALPAATAAAVEV